jgi:hypothetical protein
MLVKQFIRETLEMQGFRIESVVKTGSEQIVTIVPDLRYHPRCGMCGSPGDYQDTLSERRFRHVPLWAIPVTQLYEPCRVTSGNRQRKKLPHGSWSSSSLGPWNQRSSL